MASAQQRHSRGMQKIKVRGNSSSSTFTLQSDPRTGPCATPQPSNPPPHPLAAFCSPLCTSAPTRRESGRSLRSHCRPWGVTLGAGVGAGVRYREVGVGNAVGGGSALG